MKDSNRYAKIVEWSNKDGCYIGSAPGLMLGGCHGNDERQVFEELCQIVEETIQLYHQDGRPLPPPNSRSRLGQPVGQSFRGVQAMQWVNYVYWQEDEVWLGYLEDYPSYWTQGQTLDDLIAHLDDLCQELANSQSA